MDKKQRHLLLFTNFDQLNFTNINKSPLVKAWALLYHFRSHPTDSNLHQEFASVVQRNSVNKTSGHELFTTFYKELLLQSYDQQARVALNKTCQQSGWPVDIQIKQRLEHGDKQLTLLYFLLQEEMCYDLAAGREVPLGMQTLMMRHVRGVARSSLTEASMTAQVKFISENELKEKLK